MSNSPSSGPERSTTPAIDLQPSVDLRREYAAVLGNTRPHEHQEMPGVDAPWSVGSSSTAELHAYSPTGTGSSQEETTATPILSPASTCTKSIWSGITPTSHLWISVTSSIIVYEVGCRPSNKIRICIFAHISTLLTVIVFSLCECFTPILCNTTLTNA